MKQPVYGDIVPAPPQEQAIVQEGIEEAVNQLPPTEEQLSAEEYFNRALAKQAGDLDGAIADYNEAIRLNPRYVFAFNNRALARRLKGDFEGAISDYTEAMRLIFGNATAYTTVQRLTSFWVNFGKPLRISVIKQLDPARYMTCL